MEGMNKGRMKRLGAVALISAALLSGFAGAADCAYVPNEHDRDCYGTLLGLDDWQAHGMAFGFLHRDEHWWGLGEHYYAVSGSTFTRIEVYGSVWPSKSSQRWLAENTAKAWAALPAALRRASMPLQIIWEKESGNPVYYDQRTTERSRHVITFTGDWADPGRPWFSKGFEETLAHEMCHAVDARNQMHGLFWSETSPWENAALNDRASVSAYADTNLREDFAETCAAWFVSSRHPERRSRLAKRFPHRIAMLEDLFDLFGEVAIEGVARN